MKPWLALFTLSALALASCGRGTPDDITQVEDRPAPQADPAPAIELPAAPVPDGDARIALAAKMPGVQPGDLRTTPVPGIYELVHEGKVTYVSADGGYVFTGDLYQVTAQGEFPNLSEQRRRQMRRQLVAAMPEKEMIVFGKAPAAHTITVFTDIDCQWCRHLHSQIEDYNKLGIRVRYVAYPRTGPDTDSWFKAEGVWCAANRNKALTQAKLGEPVKQRQCNALVERQFAVGLQVGITGTPGVVLPSGELVPGYLPPADMLQAIDESGAEEAPALPAARRD
jgi:thiol:disulfide interchange protein DsbC